MKNSERAFSDTERDEVFKAATDEFAQFSRGTTAAATAARVYQPLFEEDVSKAVTAQVLAEMLEGQNVRAEALRAKLPPYIIAAIEYVTEPLPPLQPNANAA